MMQIMDRLCGIWRRLALETRPRLARNDQEVTLAVRGFIQLNSYSCGASAGFSIVATFNPHAKLCRFYDHVKPDPQQGVPADKLMRSLKAFKIGCQPLVRFTFREVRRSIDEGYPLITGCTNGNGDPHWCVLYGYGRNPNRVFLSSRSGFPRLSEVMLWREFKEGFDKVGGPAIQCWGLR